MSNFNKLGLEAFQGKLSNHQNFSTNALEITSTWAPLATTLGIGRKSAAQQSYSKLSMFRSTST